MIYNYYVTMCIVTKTGGIHYWCSCLGGVIDNTYMKKCSLLGIALLIAMSITACGGTNQTNNTELNQTNIASEAESETSSQEAASSFSSEEVEDDTVADKENLPDEMEEG